MTTPLDLCKFARQELANQIGDETADSHAALEAVIEQAEREHIADGIRSVMPTAEGPVTVLWERDLETGEMCLSRIYRVVNGVPQYLAERSLTAPVPSSASPPHQPTE